MMKLELLEAVETLLKADVLTAEEYTQIVIRIKTSNDSAQGENSSVSDNEKQKEDLYCCCWKKDYSSSNTCPKCGLKKFY